MTDWSPEAWGALIVVVLGALTSLIVKVIGALRQEVKELKVVVDGRLSQFLALTAVSAEALGVEKGRLAEMARQIQTTVPPSDPFLPALTHYEGTEGQDLVIPVPIPTPTVVIVPTENEDQIREREAAESPSPTPAEQASIADGHIADLHQQAKEEEKKP